MEHIKNFFISFGLTWMIIIFIIGLCEIFKGCKRAYNQPPVKDSINIDSLITNTDSIKIEVKSLDSIKNAKIIEVVTLDNDSSVKLFYKLVSE